MRNYTLTASHLPQLASWVGFDRMFNELERTVEKTHKTVSFPPYNVRKIDDEHFVIELAVAGFSKSDIDITMNEGQLVIKGNVKSNPEAEYYYKGIAERAFERAFTIHDSVVINNASLVDGMLRVGLEMIVPENKKPIRIEIGEIDSCALNRVDSPQLLTE